MAESPKDIESGCDPLQSPLCGEQKTSLDNKLRNFGFILALLEKGASTLGTMNFIWATAVLLGGFSQALKSIDFWYVSVILVVEGLRILCRHGELATRRSWPPHSRLLLIIRLYSLVIQELSALACVALSLSRILKQQYGSDINRNRNRALNVFYGLSATESILTLLGFIVRGNLDYSAILPPNEETSSCKRIIDILFDVYRKIMFSIAVGKGWRSALKEDGFDDSQLNTVLLFFWDTYFRCMNKSVFDGLKMDFVSYSVELLQSIHHFDQLTGARLLSVFVKSNRLPSEKLRVIGTTPGVLNMLIEMLNWEEPREQEIREVAGEIIYKLVEIPRNRIRVMVLPESMESITSFLYDRNKIEIHKTKYQGQFTDKNIYKYSDFTVLGLRILKILANDPDNCAKIGTNKGLLCKIIELDPEASESEILGHLKITRIETLASLARKRGGP